MSFKAFFESGQPAMDEDGFFTSMKDVMKFLQYNGISNFVPNPKEMSVVLTNFGGSFANVTYQHLPIRITRASEIGISDSDIENLQGLPTRLDALTLTRCHNITSLEGGPVCTLTKLYNLDGLTSLPFLLATTELHIKDCKNLDRIRDTGNATRDVRIDGCHQLTSIETYAERVLDRFQISDCPRFTFDERTNIKAKHVFLDHVFSFAGAPLCLPDTEIINLQNTSGYRNVLALLQMDNLRLVQAVEQNGKSWTDIVNHYLKTTRDVFDCQAELVEAGFEEEAEL